MRLPGILFLFLIVFPPYALARNYFVAPNGNDINAGTETQPFKTIQKAADSVSAGDKVLIKQGTYNEKITLKQSGTAGEEIIFTNHEGGMVTVDGSGISLKGWHGLFDIAGQAFIAISNLHIRNAASAGFLVEGSNNITIQNCTSYNTFSSGIGIWNSSSIVLDRNEIELACNDGAQECITVAGSANCIIRNNHVHHNGPGTNGGEGIDIKHGSHDIKVYGNLVHNIHERIGIYTDAWDAHTYNIDIFQNEVHHCGNSGFTIQTERGGLLEYIHIYNNISYYNKWEGISVGSVTEGNDTTKTPVKNITIINNTCYKNGAFEGGWGFGILVDNPDAENVLIRNNICSNNSGQIAIQKIKSGERVDHNLIHGYNNTPNAITGNNAVIGNPLFTDPEKGNFHLRKESPAIDAGLSAQAPVLDFMGNPRPVNKLWDIGAHETRIESFSHIPAITPLLLNNKSPAKARLLFSSGFEGDVHIQQPQDEDFGDYQFILGTDSETGFTWPIQILGSNVGGLHYIDDDTFQAVASEIQSVTGHDGTSTKALYSVEHYRTDATQCPYEILDLTDGRKDLYIRFWIKMDSTSHNQPNAWRTFFEWKTKDYAKGSGFRLISFVYTDENGSPHWHWQGDADPQHPVWEIDNKTIPVPVNGEWFLTEFFWHWSEGKDGRALWKINGQVVGDHYGPTTRNSKPIDFIMLTQIYGSSNPKHQWIDDIEIWDTIPQ